MASCSGSGKRRSIAGHCASSGIWTRFAASGRLRTIITKASRRRPASDWRNGSDLSFPLPARKENHAPNEHGQLDLFAGSSPA